MKRLVPAILFLAAAALPLVAVSQEKKKFSGILASESREPLRNPERGFRYEVFFMANNLEAPYFRKQKTLPEAVLYRADPFRVDSTLLGVTKLYGEKDSVCISQLYIYLTAFIGKRIPDKGIQNIRSVFEGFHQRGFKAVLRMGYDYSPNLTRVSLADIERHMAQLRPVFEEYEGVIHVFEAGLIGAWGEWHHTSMINSSDTARAVLTALFNAIPPSRQVLVRIPHWKDFTNLPSNLAGRTGFHNDFFTADEHKFAKGNDYVRGTPAFDAVQRQSPFYLIDGEMPYSYKGVDEWSLNRHFDVINGIIRLRDHHYTTFSIAHNNLENDSTNIRYWRVFPLTEETLRSRQLPVSDGYFRDANGKAVARTAFEYIRDHLGYRLELQELTYTAELPASAMCNWAVTLINRGFSTLHNPRKVYFVLLDTSGNIVATIPADADSGSWQPYNPSDSFSYDPVVYTVSSGNRKLPKLRPGTYRLGLWMPDGTALLKNDARYAVRVANSGVPWVNGVNVLTDIRIK
ncbi:DUF4832 domain-containing protein [Siphonobacter aquaeclarae]|uniref:DUF4832 domain-containing protein n=1 Tax=Siphonobacter aquaeclarae TaxID=563176 RepID=A0A1G9I0I7_9BACT|nr:DUF4874 domain-containing protein [Siphonobacter aquaeclarae]SDL18434.1 protein of unknown function [Siphonobacter aquaeclarae]